ncbi:MAG TPA: ribosome biogenesis GTPase Der [Candidatus Dependentiae bacterium]|nr:ribosome biogenesis GTPase Der [Candidatus Dependentiae bacterium]HRQ62616.1 ribosome biogenesis GTPase Der [Candidatus Dependentiae bacterium]
MSTLPRVLIVGRMNVGKSTLFNRLSTDVKSLAFDYEGVTRDFLKDTVCWQDKCFELIDTGGISVRSSQDPLIEETRKKALSLFEDADIVLFMCDGKVGVLPEDLALSKMLHKMKKEVILVINKTDAHVAQEQLYEFDQLGFKKIFPISAQHGIGIADLLEELVTILPEKKEQKEEELTCKVVLLGKPNVGKSSLLNLLLKQERAIVADIPGTTREAIAEKVRFFKEDILVTDTPGLRRQRAITEPLEGLMARSSLRALDDADIVLLLIDSSEGKLSDQELKLAFYAFEEKHKGLILLFNKQDLTEEFDVEQLAMDLDEYKYFIKKVAQLNISCKTGQNIGKVLPLVQKVWQRYSQELPIDDLTLFFKDALHKKPLYRNESLLHVHKVKQIKSAPITLLLYVNTPEWFGPSQLAYFENLLRRACDLQGVPIKFVVRR